MTNENIIWLLSLVMSRASLSCDPCRSPGGGGVQLYRPRTRGGPGNLPSPPTCSRGAPVTFMTQQRTRTQPTSRRPSILIINKNARMENQWGEDKGWLRLAGLSGKSSCSTFELLPGTWADVGREDAGKGSWQIMVPARPSRGQPSDHPDVLYHCGFSTPWPKF